MIQRKQTLWLLLSVICAALTFRFAFYYGTAMPGTAVDGTELNATDNIILELLTGGIIVVALAGIFLFANRKLQLNIAWAGLVLSLVLTGLYFYYSRFFTNGGFALTAMFTLGFIVGFLLAIQGIKSDQKLIRDLNRLR